MSLDESVPSKAEVERVLSNNNFEYQRVYLPHGLYTPGQDRTATRDIVLNRPLEGASLLDVGSANGFFCFEAESRGARRVLGLELMDKRFRHALALKGLLRSNVEFRKQDMLMEPLNESFDYVLLLNVIHHMPEPMRALRTLASVTHKQLIVEFPTLCDRKFRNGVAPRVPLFILRWLNSLPLIGASSLSNRGVDQSFVFSPKAIARVLTDHDKSFRSFAVLDSPMDSSRQIMIFTK